MYYYLAYGLRVAAELEIPGGLPDECCRSSSDLNNVDIHVRLGNLPSDRSLAFRDGPYAWCPNLVLFSMTDVGRYLCDASNNSITVEPASAANRQAIAQVLIATVLPVMLWMRGHVVLHAACTLLPGAQAALAIAGPSGIGKSTLLEQFLAIGGRVVGDDTIRVNIHSEGIMASGLPSVIFTLNPVSGTREMRYVPVSQTLTSSPLAALFVLERCASTERMSFRELKGVNALRALLSQRHRPRVLRLLGTEGEIMKNLCAILETGKLKIYSWRRPEGAVQLYADEIAFLHHVVAANPTLLGTRFEDC